MAALGDDFFVQTFTATLQKYEKVLVDNVLLEHPTLELFKKNAKSITGRGLVIPVRAADLNATAFDTASGSGGFSSSVSADIMGSAVYGWAKGIITPFRVKHREILQNSGPEQIINLVEEYVKAAAADHGDFITSKLHTLSAVWDSDSFNSLDNLTGNLSSDTYYEGVNADFASNPVGGIDPSDAGKSYWQAGFRGESSAAAQDIAEALRNATNEIYRASRKRPTHIIVGFDIYEELEAYLAEKGTLQVLGGNTVETRFNEIKFGGTVVRLDPDCQDDRAYLLNQDSLRFAYCAGEFMKAFPAQVVPGTLDTVVPLASTLTVGVSERRANGLLIRTA